MGMETNKLEELGFKHNEALVYLALIKLGQVKSGLIVKDTHLHRVLVYGALDSLINKGFVAYVIKENIKYFNATEPSRLLKLVKEKEKIAQELVKEADLLINKQSEGQKVEVYEGIKGLKTALSNMLDELNEKDEHYVFASGNMSKFVGDYYYLYQREKEKKKIKTHVIYDLSFKPNTKIIKATYGLIKYYSLGPFITDTWVYKNKVLIVNYNAEPPIAILITSDQTAKSYKVIFEGYWKKAKK